MSGTEIVAVGRRPHTVRTRTGVFVLMGLAASGWIGFVVLAGIHLVAGTDNAQRRTEPDRDAVSKLVSIATQPQQPQLVVEPRRIAILTRFEERRRIQERVREADFSDHQNGNIAAARQVYGYAADKGWAPAALALAFTYDPHELRRRGVPIPADAGKARACYIKARKLMNATVAYYLSRLPSSEGGRC